MLCTSTKYVVVIVRTYFLCITLQRFLQCCAEGSPSARTKTGWPGGLRQGDEILCISGKYVKKLTRSECIRALKESPVYVKMRIRHYFQLNASGNASYQLQLKAKVL